MSNVYKCSNGCEDSKFKCYGTQELIIYLDEHLEWEDEEVGDSSSDTTNPSCLECGGSAEYVDKDTVWNPEDEVWEKPSSKPVRIKDMI